MSVLEEVATLVQQLGTWVLGQNLYLYDMPTNPDVAIGLFEYPGLESAFTQNNADRGEADIEYPRIQIVSRAGAYDYPTARRNLDAVRRSLTIRNAVLGGTRYLKIIPLRSLTSSVLDGLKRPELTADMEAWRAP